MIRTDPSTSTSGPRDRHRQLLALTDRHHGRRVWTIAATGGYGAGLTQCLPAHAEQVVELDQPKRTARRHGATSDLLDTTRPPVRPRAATTSTSPERPAPCRAPGAADHAPPPSPGHHRRPTPTPRPGGHRSCCAPRAAGASPPANSSPPGTAGPAIRLGHQDHHDPGQPAPCGPPHPPPRPRDRRPHPGQHPPRPGLTTGAAHPMQGRPNPGPGRPDPRLQRPNRPRATQPRGPGESVPPCRGR